MVPCKGRDIMLAKGLKSIKGQDYDGGYSVIAVADSASDPSVSDIKKAGVCYIARRQMRTKGSNKVMALATAFERLRGYDVYVVADSDIVCRKDWLRLLVAPLADRRVGVSTAYPLFRPVKGSGFWAKVKMVWSFAGNGLMESERTRFAWGGSMAFRKDLLDRKSLDFFGNSVSDDIAITKIARQKGLAIHYVNKGVIEVPSDDDFGRFSEWATRQTALSIRGYKSNFTYGVVYYAASAVLLYSAILLTAFYSVFCAALLVPFAIRLAKTYGRAGSADPEIALVCLVIDAIYVANLVAARLKKEIIWRGVSYRLDSI